MPYAICAPLEEAYDEYVPENVNSTAIDELKEPSW
jgi:hypothetical protein